MAYKKDTAKFNTKLLASTCKLGRLLAAASQPLALLHFYFSYGIALVKFGRIIKRSLDFPGLNACLLSHFLDHLNLRLKSVIHPSSCKATTLVLFIRVFFHLTKTNPQQALHAEAQLWTYWPWVLTFNESEWRFGKLRNCVALEWSLLPSTNMFGMSWPK